MGQFLYMMLALEVGYCPFLPSRTFFPNLQAFSGCKFISPMTVAGYTEIVQLLINSTNNAENIKRMLETVDAEGDTVSTDQILLL